MAQTARCISTLWSNSPEIKSEMITAKDVTEARMARAVRSLIEGWYQDQAEVVFDKGRFWNLNPQVLNYLFPDAQLFVCVRDLRDIFASVEKQHAKNPLLDDANDAEQLTSYNRADRMFAPKGILGQQIMGIEDIARRGLRNQKGKPFAHTVAYETFVRSPQLILDRIYVEIGEEPFPHDFENVQNTATDVDGLYNYKFPHKGEGKVADPESDWRKHVPVDVAEMIMKTFPRYNRAFGYQ